MRVALHLTESHCDENPENVSLKEIQELENFDFENIWDKEFNLNLSDTDRGYDAFRVNRFTAKILKIRETMIAESSWETKIITH